jgi:hypothetical protein
MGLLMKQLIAATLSEEASEVWNSWPKKSKEFGHPGRSAELSSLLVKSGSMPAHIEALKLREMNLLASLAITRESLVNFLRLTPHTLPTRREKLRLQIDDIQDKTWGTIHFNYGISDQYLDELSFNFE